VTKVTRCVDDLAEGHERQVKAVGEWANRCAFFADPVL